MLWGGVWRKHHKAVSDLIRMYSPKSVLEIGGGTGILESIYNNSSNNPINWIIVEPQPHPIEGTRAKFIKGFFPDAVPENMDFDMLVHSHTMEHMYSPKAFMERIAFNMKDGQRMVFSIPNLKNNLKSGITSVINFEHTIYLTEDYVNYLLDKSGFVIEKKEYITNHSIIYSTIRDRSVNNCLNVDFHALYQENYLDFDNWNKQHKKLIAQINAKLREYSMPVYLFGGHISSQFYIAFGLNTGRIECVLDNDPFKWGKRLGGSNLKISSPSIIDDCGQVAVIIPKSPYTQEIKRDILESHNSKVIFWG